MEGTMRKGIQHKISDKEIENGKFTLEGVAYEIVGGHEDESLVTPITPFWEVFLPVLRSEDGTYFNGYIYSYSKFESGKRVFILETMEEI